MYIHDFQQEINKRHLAFGAKTVLKETTRVVDEMDQDFVDPSHVLVKLFEYPHSELLTKRLVDAGMTVGALRECLVAMRPSMMPMRSREAVLRMFDIATSLAGRRYAGTEREIQPSLGDLLFACIASRSRVIDTLIEEGMDTSVFHLLVELGAPDDLTLKFFPAATVEDVEAAMDSVSSTRG